MSSKKMTLNEDAEKACHLIDALKALEGNLNKEMTNESIDTHVIPHLQSLGIIINFTLPGKSQKNVKTKSPRLPYRQYKSSDGILIRVGRSAADNDKLSCDPQYRDDNHWWLHVSGCPGSHVVVCSEADNLPSTHPRALSDAALLAAKYSKNKSHKSTVSVTRCRYVSKLPFSPDGLVILRKTVLSLSADLHAGAARLEAMEAEKKKFS